MPKNCAFFKKKIIRTPESRAPLILEDYTSFGNFFHTGWKTRVQAIQAEKYMDLEFRSSQTTDVGQLISSFLSHLIS